MKNKVIATKEKITLEYIKNFARPKEKSFRDLQVLAIKKRSRPAREFRYMGMTLQEWNKVEWWLNGGVR